MHKQVIAVIESATDTREAYGKLTQSMEGIRPGLRNRLWRAPAPIGFVGWSLGGDYSPGLTLQQPQSVQILEVLGVRVPEHHDGGLVASAGLGTNPSAVRMAMAGHDLRIAPPFDKTVDERNVADLARLSDLDPACLIDLATTCDGALLGGRRVHSGKPSGAAVIGDALSSERTDTWIAVLMVNV